MEVKSVGGKLQWVLPGIDKDLSDLRNCLLFKSPKRSVGGGAVVVKSPEEEKEEAEEEEAARLKRNLSQICFRWNEGSASETLKISRDYFQYLAERDPSGKDHSCQLNFCCAKRFSISQDDFALCENFVSGFAIYKGDMTVIELPSFLNCNKMSNFTLVQSAKNKLKMSTGLPVMPSTLHDFRLMGVEDSDESPFDLSACLHRVIALHSMRLGHLDMRRGLEFSTCFRTLKELYVEETEGFDPTPAFWAGCGALETLQITGKPRCRGVGVGVGRAPRTLLFGALPHDVILPKTLRTIEIRDLVVPELPRPIGGCSELTSLVVSNSGLLKITDTVVSLLKLEGQAN